MKLNFTGDSFSLPAECLEKMWDCSAAFLRVLLWVASDISLSQKPKQLAKLSDCDEKTVKKALEYWKKEEILADGEESAPCVTTAEAVSADAPKLHRADEVPNYTTSELSALLETRAGLKLMVDEATNLFGKIFTTGEVNILVGMNDYLGMDYASILLLLAYCKKIGKSNLRAVEKFAITLSDKGICTESAMEEELKRLESLHSFEGKIRSMFGMGARELTGKEKTLIAKWMEFGYGEEIIRRAYEMTVNATDKPSVNYANAILEKWHAEKLSTLAEIDAFLKAEKAKKNKTGKDDGSFDTEDFFEAALRRSFSDGDKK